MITITMQTTVTITVMIIMTMSITARRIMMRMITTTTTTPSLNEIEKQIQKNNCRNMRSQIYRQGTTTNQCAEDEYTI